MYEAIDNREGQPFATKSFDTYEDATQWLHYKRDLAGYILKYEQGQMTDSEAQSLFAYLISEKIIGSMQGIYQRTATSLIEQGYLGSEGQILKPLELGL